MLKKRDRVALPWTDTLARLEDERIMLQRIAAGVPLAQVLEHVLHAIEAQSSVELRASIALVDETGACLRHAAAPSLPDAYNAAVDRVPIGPAMASWGAAAYTGCPVYVEDIASHPDWERWRDLALANGLRACWSTPIKAPDGRLLGVFSNYYGTARSPSAHDIDAIALVTRSAALAIERHLTELALRQSGERWRTMFEGMQEAFFLSEALRDADGRIADFRFLEVNPAFERQSGMKEGDTLGHTLREMIPGVPGQIMDAFAQVVESGEPAQFEFAVPAPKEAWYEARVRKDGPERIMALFLDVSARKAAESELWEGQHRKNFLLALGDSLRELHLQPAIEEAACEGLGQHLALGLVAVLDSAAENGRAVLSTCWRSGQDRDNEQPLALDRLGAEYYAALDGGRTTYLQPLLAEAQGEIRPWAIVVPLRRWGRPGGALLARPQGGTRLRHGDIAFIEEVAERLCGAVERSQYARMLEQRVEDASAERDRIWRLSPELLAVVDRQGRFISVNPAVRPILGWSPEQFLSAGLSELIHPEDLAATLAAWAWAPEGQVPQATRHLENRVLRRDGGYSWITWSMSWSQDNLYMTGRDDTDLKMQAEALRETENALRQSQKMEAVGRLTGGIAHDFNNMLQGITGALYLIERKLGAGSPEQALRFVSVAMDSANRAAHLTQRLLTFSRRQPIDPKSFSVASALQSMADLFRRYTGERVRLVFDLDPGLWTVCCDKNQFENAMLNLVINARDAMPQGGVLTIAARNVRAQADAPSLRQVLDAPPGPFVEVSVSDVGCGMTPDVLAHAFDPFYTTKPLGEGTGLGLSMIYGFAKQAGGVATLESELDVGTTVRLFLPRHEGSPERSPKREHPAAAPAPDLLRQAVVVVVEDDANVRDMVYECLAERGLRVLSAADGEAGLDLVRATPDIDLLVTDVGLPGLNGRQLADAARTVYPGLKVLLMTGYAGNAVRDRDFLEHGIELIVKPFSLVALGERVQRMLDGDAEAPQ
ncbi:Blue-light-activated protein [Achromobacter denitrificans]|jgi:PAS domain S-box-containing protein|uniref:PAS domain S-box protein n=2 Tax=Achromobacter denitrificans TaxID=32002 RepID=UPI0007882AF1|nr:PAS domain S-box protein [Achromobacter denitrificans]OLU01205.1 ATPase [Achromobacter denitrificans]QKH41224.1 PAS domain S-box protein [Achromobacter denitrificans]QKH51632.1 PAS domain S-box protein [Achromobacter denitrificans]CAB3720282.1 Sensor histidine kinase RcsC [Achromobacter denitrificans]SUU27550.1 Blue-light-activated protein [Achromobacter denitrificans]